MIYCCSHSMVHMYTKSTRRYMSVDKLDNPVQLITRDSLIDLDFPIIQR